MRREEREAADHLLDEEHQVCFDLLGVSFHYDLREKAAALFRLDEVAVVTPEKAPELASAFADAEFELAQIVNRARMARDEMTEIAKCAWARLLLDPSIKAEVEGKGVRFTKDTAEAAVRLRDEYQEPLQASMHLAGVVRKLEARQERVHKAHSTVLQVFGGPRSSRRFSAGDLGAEQGDAGRYGKPRY